MLTIPATDQLEVAVEKPGVDESPRSAAEVDVVREAAAFVICIELILGKNGTSIRGTGAVRGQKLLEGHLDGDNACIGIGQLDESDSDVDKISDLSTSIVPVDVTLIRSEGLYRVIMSALMP
jgi:hypothetical protein